MGTLRIGGAIIVIGNLTPLVVVLSADRRKPMFMGVITLGVSKKCGADATQTESCLAFPHL